MALWLTAFFGQSLVDICNGVGDVLGGSVDDWLHEDVVAVVVICYNQIVVTIAGRLREPACLVQIDQMCGFHGCKETCVCACIVRGLLWESVFIVLSCWVVFACASRVFALCVKVSHGGGL